MGQIKGIEADAGGLACLVAERGMGVVLFELYQNAADEQVTRVDITIEPVPNRPVAMLKVVDDAPEGYRNLAHFYTLFAESYKKDDPSKAGRYNFGCKVVLSLCTWGKLTTTKGSVRLDSKGRHMGRKRTKCGSVIEAELPCTRDQLAEIEAAVDMLIPRKGITVTFNGRTLERPEPTHTFHLTLPTVTADDKGRLTRNTRRTCKVELFEPKVGDAPHIYELGIPVVDLGGGERWHVNIGQKVPLNINRDNVTPAYLRTVRVGVLNAVHDDLETTDASQTWARAAAGDDRATPQAINKSLDLRFGERRVSFDMSDQEANKLATSKGFTVVSGGSLSGDEWRQAKRVEAIQPAGQVTPSPKAYGNGTGPVAEVIDPDLWTADQVVTAGYCAEVCRRLLDLDQAPKIKIVRTHNSFSACWKKLSDDCAELHLNVRRLGAGWFALVRQGDLEPIDDLLIHEAAHQYSSDHLSDEYHRALCRLGARLARLNRQQPGLGFHHKEVDDG